MKDSAQQTAVPSQMMRHSDAVVEQWYVDVALARDALRTNVTSASWRASFATFSKSLAQFVLHLAFIP